MPRAPVIVKSIPDGNNLEAYIGSDVTLTCEVDALPSAETLWIDNKVVYACLKNSKLARYVRHCMYTKHIEIIGITD